MNSDHTPQLAAIGLLILNSIITVFVMSDISVIFIGTSFKKERVEDAIGIVGFYRKTSTAAYTHDRASELMLEFHDLRIYKEIKELEGVSHVFKGVEGMNTGIEFYVKSGELPKDRDAIEILRELYEEIPDLKYCERMGLRNFSLAQPLGNYLARIK